jgi:acetyl-CoA carboxylase biotin carboxyl carrier protein
LKLENSPVILGIFSFNPYFSRPNKTVNSSNMDFKQIQELIKMINKSNIGEVSIEEKGFKLTIKQKEEPVQQVIAAPMQTQPVATMAMPGIAAAVQAPVVSTAEKPVKAAEAPAGNTVTIKSPMIGTFYRSPSPDKPSFVNVGDEITPGKVVCIIEAMKLFNEIESEISGKIVKVLVEDASPVEYDQPLFLVEP